MKKRSPRLGQHFLTSSAIAYEIAAAGNIRKGETVLEVGPGKGMLTRALLNTGATVVAIEKDPALTCIIYDTFSKEISRGQLRIIERDVRDPTLNATLKTLHSSYKVIANIPYYITGELIRMFLTAQHQPSTIVFLVQKEVAERIARSKKESLLSLSVKAYGTPRYIKTVKAGSFSPSPAVDSAILAIENISRKNFANVSEEKFFEILHAGFGQKRKTLLGNLKRTKSGHPMSTFEEAWVKLGLNPKVRAEDVPLEAWLALAKNL